MDVDNELPLRMSAAEADLFKALLANAKYYLEWGSGGSTLAATRSPVRSIVSVETDVAWIDQLKKRPEIASAIEAKRLTFHHINVGPVREWGIPVSDEKLREWPRYAVAPFVATDLDFDLILVDGRFRLHCLLSAACCAENALIFLHDYKFRHSYTLADKYFETLKRVDTGALLKRRSAINLRSLYIDLISSIFIA